MTEAPSIGLAFALAAFFGCFLTLGCVLVARARWVQALGKSLGGKYHAPLPVPLIRTVGVLFVVTGIVGMVEAIGSLVTGP